MARGHSRIGPSKGERIYHCTGSVRLSEQAPPDASSPFADQGTAAHFLGERCLSEEKDPGDYVHQHIRLMPNGSHHFVLEGKGEEGDHLVDFDMADAVRVYVKDVRVARAYAPDAPFALEAQLDGSFLHPELHGQGDAVLGPHNRTLALWDYKHGQGVLVEHIGNWQMLQYGLMAGEGVNDWDRLVLTIVQPRCYHPEGKVRRWVVSRSEAISLGNEMKLKLLEATEGSSELHAGKWCRFCPAKTFCPEISSAAQRMAKVDFAKPLQPTIPEDPAKLSQMLAAFPMMEFLMKAVRSRCLQLALTGTKIPGKKPVAGKLGDRAWVDKEKASAIFGKRYGVGATHADPKPLTPTQMEKQIGKALKGRKETGFKKLMEEHVTRAPGKPTLVDDSDKRPSIASSAEDDFKALPGAEGDLDDLLG